jgi:NFU1 iron-sulfur cluster scaffold homolog, mitochondrial
MEQPIKIMAEVSQYDASTCKFTVDRPIFREFVRFTSKERAKGSPLVERLFAIEGIAAVLIQGQDVTVTKAAPVDWRLTGPLVGAALRAHIASGEPAVSDEAVKNAPAEDVLRLKVQKVLDDQINPAIASHGGTISLIDVQGTTLYIKMGGGCQGCSQADVTLRQGVETSLREQLPEIGQILDVTDHAGGKNPYYAAH